MRALEVADAPDEDDDNAFTACSERGMTVMRRSCSRCATSRHVVPLSSTTDSPSEIMPATAVAMRRLASRFSSARRANGGSEPRSRRLRAPPRKRSSTPWAARISRSRRMVISDAPVSAARSATPSEPASRTASVICFSRDTPPIEHQWCSILKLSNTRDVR